MSTVPSTKKCRVLVVEDSLTIRKRIVEVLSRSTEFEVVGEAADGKEGIELTSRLRPDVITMDMMLPVMTGLAATEYIMAHFPTPILIVSASTNRGELFRTYEALAAGAVDVLEKPLGTEADAAWEAKLVSTLRIVSRVLVITHVRGKLNAVRVRPAREPDARSHHDDALSSRSAPAFRAVAIGASTGGPSALAGLLGSLPPSFPLPILMVLHIGEPFGAAFAEWLDGQSPLRVAYAKDGDPLPPVGNARVLLAPPNLHLELRDGKVRLTSEPERHSCRPSVDVLFESVARDLGASAIACLLTGMGRDGALGMLAVKQANGATIAQDEATSVVYGMPREAVRLGAADRVLPLPEIAPALVEMVAVEGKR